MAMESLLTKFEDLQSALLRGDALSGEELFARIEAMHHRQKDLDWASKENSDYQILCQDLIFLLESAQAHVLNENHGELEGYFEAHLSVAGLDFGAYDGRRGHRIQILEQKRSPIYIVGDLHGDVTSFQRMLDITDFYEAQARSNCQSKWLFLGDYLDRGKRQIELLERLLLLKALFPKSVYLLRGNHELGHLEEGAVKLGIRKPEIEPDTDYLLLLLEKNAQKAPEETSRLLNRLITFFQTLSICGFLKQGNTTYMLNHGGIIRPKHEDLDNLEEDFFTHFSKLSELTSGAVLDDLGNTLEHNLLWSDPSEEWVLVSEQSRRFRFHLEHFSAYRKTLGFDVLIRGHEAFPEGIKHFFEKRIVSVFSSGSEDNTDTAYCEVTPKIVILENNMLTEKAFD